MKAMMQVSVAVEEIYVNIARYAYHSEIGEATVRCSVGGDPMNEEVLRGLSRAEPPSPLAEQTRAGAWS